MADDRILEHRVAPGWGRRLEAQARLELEKAEQQAALLSARRKRLEDVGWEAVQSGCRLLIRVGMVELEGVAVYASNDLLSLETAGAVVEVCLPNVDAVVVKPGAVPGRAVPKEAESFAARLAVLQIYRESVEVLGRGGQSRFHGLLSAVARDHLVLETSSGQAYVPLAIIACVIRSHPTG